MNRAKQVNFRMERTTVVTVPSGEKAALKHDRGSLHLESPIPPTVCRSIEWYSEGQTRMVEVAGIQILVRFVGRKGRRGRIAIEAPGGAVFKTGAGDEALESGCG